ncbi:MAG: hypothetical protein DRJ07_08325 [Bacteroidetes bacterium]|nr:MAG: hypothetical protein DRJ07_08325 [Bacteroidota bacterium]
MVMILLNILILKICSKTIKMKLQIPKKINSLVQYLESKQNISVNELLWSIKSLNINLSDIGDYINFNHDIHESYGRSVIYESNKVEIVLMSWNKEDYTSIHDHGYAQFGAVYSFGDIQNNYFKIENNTLKKVNETILKKGEITIIDNNSIHQMGNPYKKPTLSLHVYYTNKNVKSVTGEARNFDLYSQTVYRANGGAFLDIPKKDIVSTENCPGFDNKMYDNYLKILQQFLNKNSHKSISGKLRSFVQN